MSEVEQSSSEKNEIIKEKERLDDENNKNEENPKEQNQNNEEEKEDASLGEEGENNIEEEEEEKYDDQKINGEEEYNEEESSKKEGEKEQNIDDDDVQNSKKEEEENSENEIQKSLEEEKKEEDGQNKNEVNNEEKTNGQDKEQNEENIKDDNAKEEEQIEIKSENENDFHNENENEESDNNKNNILEEKEIIQDNNEKEEERKELINNEKEKNEQNQDNYEKEENKIIKDNIEVKENELIQDNKETEENKNKEIINEPNKTNTKKSEFKVIKNIEITHIQNNKLSGIEKERERPYTKREEKESDKKRIKEIEVNGRPHYVFYYKSSKTTDNSSMNTLDSMSYSNSKSRPNYQFLCSFGTKNSSQKRNQTYLLTSQKPITKTPIGIASTTAKTDIYNSPKNKLYDIISKSDMKATKSTNIFKPVPRTLIQTTKMQTRYQPRKYEYEPQKKTYNKIGNCILLSNRQNKTINNLYGSHNTTKYNSTKHEEKKQINKDSTFISYFHTNNTNNSNNVYYLESDRDRPRVKYYIRCPNCNFPLNDEKEVNKIYSQKSFNPSYESRRKNLEKDSYANKTYIKSSCTDYNKYKFQTISNISNNKKEDISVKNGKIGSYLFRSCIQNSINFSSPKEKPVRSPKRHHNFYQSYGTSATSGKNPTKF